MKALGWILAVLGLAWIAPASASERQGVEAGVLARINYARQHPQQYADELRRYRTWFRGNILYLPGDREGVLHDEGVAAVDEAIAFLERQAPLPPLDFVPLLALAASDHAAEQGPAGAVGHGSFDGSSPGMRVKRRGGDIYVGENIAYGFADPDQIVRQFIVDDGVPDRGHRDAIFDRDYRFAGVGCGPHTVYRHMCVVEFAQTRDGSPEIASWTQSPRVQLASTNARIPAPWSVQPQFQPAVATVGGDEGEWEVIEVVEVFDE